MARGVQLAKKLLQQGRDLDKARTAVLPAAATSVLIWETKFHDRTSPSQGIVHSLLHRDVGAI